MTATARLDSEYIGKVGRLVGAQKDVGDAEFEVRVIDVKRSYGKTSFLVEPIAGTGSVWVGAHRVVFLFEESNDDSE